MRKTENKYFIFDSPQNIGLKNLVKQLIRTIKGIGYKVRLDSSHPVNVEKKSYDVTICAIFKNEAPYLKEWIEYHKIVGVKHFYMYNNNSEDDYMSVLQEYIDAGDVTLIDWPYKQAQMEAYGDCVCRFKNEAQWIGFIDIDEFVVPKSTDDIYGYLKGFEKNRGAVIIYWKLFGTSGLINRNIDDLVTEDFYVCWRKYCDIGKCFYNTSYDLDPQFVGNRTFHHSCWTRYKGKNFPPVDIFDKVCVGGYHSAKSTDFPIQINHYFTKSYEEYVAKRAKGDVYFAINPHDEDYFYHHEMKCGATDYSAYKYLIKLKTLLKK